MTDTVAASETRATRVGRRVGRWRLGQPIETRTQPAAAEFGERHLSADGFAAQTLPVGVGKVDGNLFADLQVSVTLRHRGGLVASWSEGRRG